MLQKISEIESVVLKLVLIVGIIAVGSYLGLSIWGNMMEARQNKPVDYPDISKAKYEFTLMSTGQKLFTDNYQVLGDGIYRLSNFYDFRDGKYRLMKNTPLVLDETIWGDIRITER